MVKIFWCFMDEELTKKVIGLAIDVHREQRPGLLESSYEQCLMYELRQNNISAQSQVVLPIDYKGNSIDAGYRLDIVIPGQLIIELKAVCSMLPIHSAQLLTYLKLSGIKTGLLIDFNVEKLVDGIKRLSC